MKLNITILLNENQATMFMKVKCNKGKVIGKLIYV